MPDASGRMSFLSAQVRVFRFLFQRPSFNPSLSLAVQSKMASGRRSKVEIASPKLKGMSSKNGKKIDPSQAMRNGTLKKFIKHVAGVERSTDDVLAEVRGYVNTLITKLTLKSQAYAQHAKRRTLLFVDLKTAADSLGIKVYGSEDSINVKRVKPGKGVTAASKNTVYLSPTAVRTVASHVAGKMRFSGAFLGALQMVVEEQLLHVLQEARVLTIKIGGRSTLQSKDLSAALALDCVYKKLT